MSSFRLFLLSAIVAAAAVVFYSRVVRSPDSSTLQPQPAQQVPQPAENESANAGPQERASKGFGAFGAPREPALARPPSEDQATASDESAESTARRLAANETLTRDELRATLERLVAGKLEDREVTPSNYDRLIDAILRIRAAQRVLQGIPDTDENAGVRERYTEDVRQAFAELQDVTGVAPSQMGDVLADHGAP